MTDLRVLLIDSAVENYQHLIQGLVKSVRVIVIQPDQDGVQQFVQLFQTVPGPQEIHVVAHGAPGCLFLGNTQLSLDTLEIYAGLFQPSPRPSRLFLYGCKVAAGDAGQEFIAKLHHMTGAAIAASTTPIGHALLGGNWELDYQTAPRGADGTPSCLFAPATLAGYAGLLNSPPSIIDALAADGVPQVRLTAEDNALTIRDLAIADADPADVMTVRLSVSSGSLTVVNTSGLISISDNGSASVLLQGTVAAVNSAIDGMVFTPLPNESGSRSLSVQVDDGVNPPVSQTVAIAITPVNDAPTIAPSAPDVAEGGTVTFAAANFNLEDLDNLPAQLIIKIQSLPSKGVLLFDGSRVVPGSTFSSDQITRLSYRHNGTQTTSAGGTSDSFTITVDDGAGGLIGTTTIPINITPVNQLPTVTSNNRLFEGQTDYRVTLTISDVDQTNPDFLVEILSLPQDGVLRILGEATPLTIGRQLTATDLANLVYSHDGNDQNSGFPPPDSFQVRVYDDGGGTGVPGSTTATIDLLIIPNNDDPILSRNTGMMLNTAGGTLAQVITPAQLQVTDPDSANTLLTYTLTETPDATLGTLQRFVGGSWQTLGVGATFTQDDINDGRVRYIFHRASSGGETFSDRFRFTVKDSEIREYPTPREGGIWDGATLVVHTFDIAITIPPGSSGGSGNAPPTTITGNNPPTIEWVSGIANLEEGGSRIITRDLLRTVDTDNQDSQLIYRITELPTSGSLRLNGRTLGLYESFSQQDINENRVSFVHAGGEDFIDRFKFTVSDGTDRPGDPIEGTFNIDIRPENDAPTVTVLGTPSLAEGGTVLIDESILRLNDVDGSGEKRGEGFARVNTLTFRVTNLPVYGQLQVFRSGSWATIDTDTVITLEELNDERFRYVHDGSENFADSFVVEAIDDSGAANNRSDSPVASRTVNIEIARLNDAPSSLSTKPLTVAEGGVGTIRGSNGLNGPGDEDDDPNLIYQDPDNTTIQRQFRITTNTAHGTLFLNGKALSVGSVFTQDDLDNDRVSYRHNGSESQTDSFAFEVRDGGGVVVPGSYDIFITPRNDAPTVAAPAEIVFATTTAQTFTGVNQIAIADVDLITLTTGETNRIRVTLDPQRAGTTYANGTLNLATTTGLTFIDPDTGLPFASGDNNTIPGNRLIIEGAIADVQAALNSLTYQVSTDVDDLIQLVVTVDDRLRDATGTVIGANGGTTNANGLPLSAANNTVQRVITLYTSNDNDAPTFANIPTARTVAEEQPLSFTGANRIEIADPDAFPIAAAVGRVRLEAGNGNLSIANLNGATISGGANGSPSLTLTGTRDQINAALLTLTYQGQVNYTNTTTPDTLTVTVLPSTTGNGVGLGGSADVSRAIAITVTPVNDTPIITAPSTPLTASSIDPIEFQAGTATAIVVDDPDLNPPPGGLPGTNLLRVRLDPTAGWTTTDYGILTLGSTAGITILSGTSGGTITQAAEGATGPLVIEGTREAVQAALNNLSYTPPVNADRTVALTVTVFDRENGGTGERTASRVININASSINDPPVLTAPTNPLTVPEDGVLIFTGAGNVFSFDDPDDFGANNLTVTVSLSNPAAGTLSLPNPDGTTVTGGGASPLVIQGTEAQINAALDGLVFTPTADFNGIVSLTVTVNDQGNVGVGPAQTDTRSVNITVTPVNDAPNATGPATLASVPEDSTNPAGDRIANLLSGSYNDNRDTIPNGSSGTPLAGIAIVGNAANSATQGTWQYNTGSGWTTIPTTGLSTSTALVIPATADLRFVPVANFNGTPGSLTVHLSDGTGFVAGSGQNISGALGGTHGWSANSVTIATSITPVNDAPLASGAAILNAINEDTTSHTGSQIASLFNARFSDSTDNQTASGGSSANTLAGVAIIGNSATAAQGTWQYQRFNGTTWEWVAVGDRTSSNALLLAATDTNYRLRFLPAPNYNGTPGGLTVRLIDNSAGAVTHGATIDLSGAGATGGTTQYSAGTVPVSVTVNPRNDAPIASGSSSLPAVSEDTTNPGGATLASLLSGNYSDATDTVPGGSSATPLAGVAIVGNAATAAQGVWQFFNGTTWVTLPTTGLSTTSAYVLAASTPIRFLPAPDFNGTPGSLTLHLSDGTGFTAGASQNISGNIGGTGGWSVNTVPLSTSVTPVNDAPSLTVPGTQLFDTPTPLVFNAANGNRIVVSDPDLTTLEPGETDILQVTLDLQADGTTYGASTLTLGALPAGLTVTEGTSGSTGGKLTIRGTRAEVQAALDGLQVQVPTDEDRLLSLVVTVDDLLNGDPAIAPTGVRVTNTILIKASNVNDDPVVNHPAAVTATEDERFNFTGVNAIAISDADSFDATNNTVTLSVTNGILALTDTSLITAGANNSSSITLTGSISAINAVLAGLSYQGNLNFNTIAPNTDTLSIQVNDQGNLGSGGARIVNRTVEIAVTPVNDAPGATGSATLTAVAEDSTDPAGTSISTLLSSNYNDNLDDVPNGSSGTPLAGIAIVGNAANSATQGTWQYNTGSGWTTIPTTGLSTSTALVIPATADLRFVPVANFNGTPGSLTVHLSDGTGFVAGSGQNISGMLGGTHGWSLASVAIATSVTPVNDAPLASGSATLLAVNEDTSDPAGATVSTLFTPRFDDTTDAVAGGSSAHTLAGVAIVGNSATSSQGTWEYFNGTDWVAVGSPTTSNALLVASTHSLRFVPAAHFNGTPGGLTVHLIDSSAGAVSSGTTVDLSGVGATGGATPYSSSTVPLSTSVTAVNDAPTASGTASLAAVAEDTTNPVGATLLSLLSGNYSDATDTVSGGSSATPLAGVAIVGNSATAAQGTWEYFNGVQWVAIATTGLATTNALVLAASTPIRFVPAPNFNGTPGPLTVHLSDGTGFIPGTGQDISGAIGGTAGWSTGTVAIATTITAVNDAPLASGNATLQNPINEDSTNPTGEQVADLFTPHFSDPVDQVSGGSAANSLAGIAIVGNAATPQQGTWQYFDGAAWVNVGDRTPANALVVAATTEIRFVPAADFSGEIPALTVHLIDNSSGSVTSGTTVDLSGSDATGGITPYSATTVTLSGLVTVENDPPVVDLDGNDSSGVIGNDYRTLFTAGSPVAIADPDISITDSDDTHLQSAVITLVNRPDGANEQLTIVGSLPAGILATAYDPLTGELHLSGRATLADYQTAIAAIVYNNTARIRNLVDRSITVTVSDGFASSLVATTTILSDYDGDGIPDQDDLDDDNDGIPDVVEMGGDPNRDTDGDGVIDRLDLDSDNDGITDLKESGLPFNVIAMLDANNDGVIDSTQSFGSNGLADNVEQSTDSGLLNYAVADTDRDGRFDFQDLDSDNDGTNDLRESGYDLIDIDNDGRVDGPDSDGDGLPDSFDGSNTRFGGGSSFTTLRDTDGDALPDFRDVGRTLNGSSGPDRIIGTDGDDILNGFSDRDVIYGRGGNDLINGGSDADILRGDEGDDIINGGTNNDDLAGGDGNDILNGGDGHDLMRGGNGDDVLNGGRGNDRMFGDAGNDILTGGNGSDRMFGGLGNDLLIGGRGDDMLNGGAGSDRLSGGQGADVFVYRSRLDFGDVIQDFEIVRDRIDLREVLGGRGSMNHLRFRQIGTDTEIQVRVAGQFSTLGILENVNARTLRANHFIF